MANISRSRKSGFVLRGGVMRRESLWIGIVATTTSLPSAGNQVLFSGFDATTLGLRPFTIVRTRGFWRLHSDQEGADEIYAAGLGMAIVSDQALAIGVTAVPTPDTDRDSDLWFLYEELAGSFSFISGLNAFDLAPSAQFDSKAMRKVEDGSDIAIVLQSNAISSGVIAYKSGRLLIKLH